MAAAYRAGWSNSTPAIPLNITTSTVAHDMLVAYGVTDGSSDTLTWPGGFTQQASLSSTLDGMTFGAATKANASGSEGTLSISSSSSGPIGGILAFSGVDNTTPLDVAVVTSSPASAASPWTASATITPVTDGCMIVALLADDTTTAVDVAHSVATTSGTTGAWTSAQDLWESSGFRNGAAFYALQTTAGAVTVQYTGTAAGATANPRLILLALRPVAAASSTGGIVLPRRRMARQPQVAPALDRSNPLTRGVTGLWVPGSRNLAAANGAVTFGSTMALRAGSQGMAWRGNNDINAYADTGVTASALGVNGAAARTIVALFQPSADSSTTNGGAVWAIGTGNFNNRDFSLRQKETADPTGWMIQLWSGDIYFNLANTANTARAVIVTYDGTQVQVFDSAAPAAPIVSTTIALDTFDQNFLIGKWNYANDTRFAFNGDIFLTGVWNRVWSAAERQRFFDNPWQLLQAPQPARWALSAPAAGTGAALLPLRRMARQPQVALPIDWSNPLTRGLQFAWHAASGYRDLVSGAQGAPRNGLLPLVTIGGRVMRSANGVADITFGTLPRLNFFGKTAQTIFTEIYMPDVSDVNMEGMLFGKVASVWNWHAFVSASNQAFGYATAGDSLPISYYPGGTNGLLPWDKKVVPFLGTYGRGLGNYYVAGQRVVTDATVAGSFPNNPTDPFSLFSRGDTTNVANAVLMGLVLIWDRELSPAEAYSLSANPWQLFRAPQPWRLAGSVAAAPTLGAAWLPRRPMRQQPQGRVLAPGYAFALAGDLADAVTGAQGIPSGTPLPVRSVGRYGGQWTFGGGSVNATPVSYGNAAAVDLFGRGQPATLHVLCRPTAVVNMGILGKSDANSSQGWLLYTDAIGRVLLAQVGSAGNASALTTTSLTANQWVLISVVDRAGGNPGASDMTIYLNAVDAGASVSGWGGSHDSDAGQPLTLGSTKFATANDFSGDIALVAAARRAQSLAEIQALVANPWQIFQAPQPLRWIGMAGAAVNYGATYELVSTTEVATGFTGGYRFNLRLVRVS